MTLNPVRKLNTLCCIFVLLLMVAAGGMSCYLCLANPNIGGDGFHYLVPVRNLFEGNGYTFEGSVETKFSPGYGLLAYPFYLLTGLLDRAGMLASAISFVLVIPVTYMATRTLFGVPTALLAAFFVALCPPALNLSYVTLAESSFALFVMLSFAFFTRVLLEGNTLLGSVLLGSSAGIAYLIRPEGFLIALLIGLSLVGLTGIDIYRGRPKGIALLSRIACPLITIACVALVSLPWILHIHRHTGTWKIATKGGIYYGEYLTDGWEHLEERMKQHPEVFTEHRQYSVINYIRENTRKFLLRVRMNLRTELTIFLKWTYYAWLPLVGMWLIYPVLADRLRLPRLRWDSRVRAIGLSYGVFLSPLPVLAAILIQDRNLLPYTFLLLTIIAAVTMKLLEKLVQRPHGIRFPVATAAVYCLTAVVAVPLLCQELKKEHYHPPLRAAGIWLKEAGLATGDFTVMAPKRGSVVAFYADGQRVFQEHAVSMPADITLEDVGAWVAAQESRLLVLDKGYVKMSPKLLPLWNNPESAETYGLRLLHRDGKRTFQIYVTATQGGGSTSGTAPAQ